jgi:cell wall-associated NlpC family hydrolase
MLIVAFAMGRATSCPNPSANSVGGEEEGTLVLATSEQARRSTALRASRWGARCVVVGTVAALSLGPLWTGSAMADPGSPATSDQAQQVFLDSAQRAGAPNQDVLVAQEEFSSASAGRSAAARVAAAAARSKEGSPYVYRAAGPNAFDCSGLTYWAWAQAGVRIPRTSRGQAGLPSVPLSQLRPGDLVTYYSPVHHVAMYIGNGRVIHASTESRPVYITTVNRAGPNPSGHRVNG